MKEDSGEGGAIADPPAAPTPEVNQQMSDDRCELQRGCCFTFTLQIFFFFQKIFFGEDGGLKAGGKAYPLPGSTNSFRCESDVCSYSSL